MNVFLFSFSSEPWLSFYRNSNFVNLTSSKKSINSTSYLFIYFYYVHGFGDTNIVQSKYKFRFQVVKKNGIMGVWFGLDRGNIHQAEMKPPCCQSGIGLESVWNGCQLQKKPQVLPVAGLRGLRLKFRFPPQWSHIRSGLKEALYREKHTEELLTRRQTRKNFLSSRFNASQTPSNK